MKKIAIVLAVLGIGVAGYWLATGAHIFTQTQVPVPVKDELFGTTTMEWKKEFHPGLEYIAPITIILFLGAGVLLWKSRRDSRRLAL